MKKYSAIKDMYYGNRGAHDTIKIENEHYYIEGFRFGFLMAMDILNH